MEEINLDGLKGKYYSGERGTFILIHGLLSSSGEFFDYPEKLNSQGFSVIVFDLSGHGKSSGLRGYESMEKNLMDLKKIIEHFQGRTPEPIILLGHSLGAATVIYALAKGMGDLGIAIAPPASIKGEMKPSERLILPVLYVISRIYKALRKKPMYITYRANYVTLFMKEETVRKAREIRFLGDKICMDSYPELMKIDTIGMAKKVNVPCMVITPENDQLVKPESQKRVYEALNGPKKYYVARGYNHSVMGEDSGEILEEIIRFVEDYIK